MKHVCGRMCWNLYYTAYKELLVAREGLRVKRKELRTAQWTLAWTIVGALAFTGMMVALLVKL